MQAAGGGGACRGAPGVRAPLASTVAEKEPVCVWSSRRRDQVGSGAQDGTEDTWTWNLQSGLTVSF